MSRVDEMKLTPTDKAMLQARHVYNDAKIVKYTEPTGFTVGSQDVTITMNAMAWGIFESTLLKAFKDREDLRTRNPELVAEEKTCAHCNGAGDFPYSQEENAKMIAENNKGLDIDDPFYCSPDGKWSKHCSPCQGTGITLKSIEN